MAVQNIQNSRSQATLSAPKAKRKLRKNCKELRALMASGYVPYLKSETIVRLQTLVARE